MFEFMEETITKYNRGLANLLERERKERSEHSGKGTVGTKGKIEERKERKKKVKAEWKELIKPLELYLDGDRKLSFSITQDGEKIKEPKVNIRIMYLTNEGEYRHTVQGFTFPLEFLEPFREELDKLEIACTKIGI